MVQSDRKFCEGLALAYVNSAKSAENAAHGHTHLAFAVTNFRRAGAHAILLDDFASAATLFSTAAQIYASFEMPYALMMAVLAGDLMQGREIFDGILKRLMGNQKQPSRSLERQGVYTLLYDAATRDPQGKGGLDADGAIGGLWRELHASSASPIGILGLPLIAYLNLASTLSGSRDISPEEALVPFLNAYNIAIRQTSLNGYHWTRMALPFHPAEPDVLSVVALSHLALMKRGESIFGLLERFPLAWASRLILVDALRERFRAEEPA
jgi:hypothetical protein